MKTEQEQNNVKKEKRKKFKRSAFHIGVNIFVGIFIGILVLLLLAIGFMQTSTFREYLRGKIIEEVNANVNGKFFLDEIDGTILTTIELKNFGFIQNGDTVIHATEFNSSLAIMPLFTKRILLKKIELVNPQIKYVEFLPGKWTIDELFYSSQEPQTDTASAKSDSAGNSAFPFTIEVANLKITNASLLYRDYSHKNSDSVYRFINYSDLNLKNLNLELNAVANISKKDFFIRLKNFNFDANVNPFRLKNLELTAHVAPDYTELKNFRLQTDSADIKIAAKLNGFSLAKGFVFKKDLPASVQLSAEPFCFSDLDTFLPSLHFLRGKINAKLNANGKFGDLKIPELNLEIGETNLALKGKLKNLHDAKNLYIDAGIAGSINYNEIDKLLAGLELPKFDNLNLDSVALSFSGEPLKFDATISAKIDTGKIRAKAFMDITKTPIAYDYEVETENLDLQSVINRKTNLNLTAKVKGESFDISEMNGSVETNIKNSVVGNYNIPSLTLNSKSKSGDISLNLNGEVNGGFVKLKSELNLNEENEFVYLKSKIANMNLAKILNDTSFASNINLDLSLNAEDFSTNNISADLQIDFDSTEFRGSKIFSGKKLTFSIWNDSTKRHVDLRSPLIDAGFVGKFDYNILGELLVLQFTRAEKILDEDFYAKIGEREKTVRENTEQFPETEIHYNIVFNSTDVWAKIFNINAFTIGGYSFGEIRNARDEFYFNNNSYFSEFIYVDGDNLFYLENANLKAKLKNSNLVNDVDSLSIVASVKGDKIVSGAEITDANISLIINGGNASLGASATLDSLVNVQSAASVLSLKDGDEITFDLLRLSTKNIAWEAKEPAKLFFTNRGIEFRNFSLFNGDAKLSVLGKLALTNDGNSDLKISLEKTHVKTIDAMFFNNTLGFDGNLSINTRFAGTLTSPQIETKASCIGFSYDKAFFGNILLNASYENSLTSVNLKMVNPKFGAITTPFELNGTIEKDFFGESNQSGNIDMRFKAKDFRLKALSPLIEDLQHIRGKLNADLKISGNLDNPSYNGFVNLKKGGFYVTANGLDYKAGGDIAFEDKILNIKDFYVKNDSLSGFNGRVDLKGKISLDKYKFDILGIELDGGLGLLSDKTKYINPFFYGNLYVETGDRWKFSYVNGKAYLEGKLKIVDADVTISSQSGGSEVDLSDIQYEYVADSNAIGENKAQELLEKYIEAQLKKASENNNENNESLFDYNLTFDIVNRATLNFVFSKVANQKLKAIITGSMKLASIKGEDVVQGEFRLLPGSRLDFFRTFEAAGVIRFERDLLNPYLDITAVYKGVHYKSAQTEGIAEEEVAVKIKLEGLLKDLGENLTAKKSNIAVYVGKKNIDNNIPDPKLDASDAMSFILIGKFNNDLSSSEQYKFSNELTSTTTAMLGTVMGVFLNSAMGDLINDVDISKTHNRTKIMLKGRLGRFYYSIGGSQEVFQDIAQANWKVEYFFNKNLSLRLERREPLTGYLSNTQMTDEVGIKYKVSF